MGQSLLESQTDGLGNEADPVVKKQFQDAVALMRAEKFVEAVQLLEDLTKSTNGPPAASVNLGIAYVRLGRESDAKGSFLRATVDKPENVVAYNQLGILHRKAGRFQQARISYEKALTARPDYALAHLNLGILCDIYLRELDCALHHYEKYQHFSTSEDKRVALWIADLKQRIEVE